MGRFGSVAQLKLFDGEQSPLGVEGTFRPNHEISVHRWYPYLEGFSQSFVIELMDEFGSKSGQSTLYEPFGGSGTTPTVAAFRGDNCYYSEINPFMRLVTEAKTTLVQLAYPHRDGIRDYFAEILLTAQKSVPSLAKAKKSISKVFGDKPYFSDNRLREILAIHKAIDVVPADHTAFSGLARLCLGAIAIGSSELKRAGDLRYRTTKEKLSDEYSVTVAFSKQAAKVCDDLLNIKPPRGHVEMLTESALDKFEKSDFADLVITSPPYLNGTNYIRNAKLELWLTGFLTSEKGLAGFRREAVTAGICDVVKAGRELRSFDFVEEVACRLDEVTYDRRIPTMVRRYFSDSALWLENIRVALKPGGSAVVDIGDSRFAGIHVPTDKCLARIAELQGLILREERFVRSRKSKDGSPLKQVLLILEKPTK